MMKILFRRTSAYENWSKKPWHFEYLHDIGLQKINPAPAFPYCFNIETKLVLHSTLWRAFDSLPPDGKTIYSFCSALNEIVFDLSKMCTENELKTLGQAVIRQKFKEFFVNDKLPTSRKEIFNEVRHFLETAKSFSQQKEISAVSHSFRMKIIEAYLKTNGEVEHVPKLIENYIIDNEAMFEFEKGFDFEI